MLFNQDALYYAEQIRNKKVTVTELVERALSNIEMYNTQLNALSHVQKADALEKAQQFDEQIIALSTDELNALPPFFGIPILLKDLGQEEADQPSTNGSNLMNGYISEQTSNFTKKVLDSGFIVVGRTNVPEFGFKNESDSAFTGAVSSPFDNTLNAGGSSGGAAAALKAGLVPIVTASDGGGSIRIPASFNGLIGLKPTRGRTPVGPGSYRGWQGASIDFALTKSVRDTWAMLKTMQVEQFEAPFVLPRIEDTKLKPLKRKLKLAYSVDSPIKQEVTEDAKRTVLVAIEKLKDFGHELVDASPATDGIRAMESYYIVNGVETASMIDGMEQNMGTSITVDDMEPMSWALYRSGLKVTGVEYSQVLAFWDQLAAITEEFFEEYDALILPSTNGPAFKHDHFKQTEEFIEKLKKIDSYSKKDQQALIWEMFQYSLAYTPFTQQQNLTGQPAISLPLYKTDTGLPVGTQIWTRKGNEMLLLQIAKLFEDEGLLDIEILNLHL